jgi:predicted RNA methylase
MKNMQFKRDVNQNSNKLNLDKYYTSDETAQYCIDVARKVLKGTKIIEVIEPSAGNGVFSKKIKNCIAYDIEPEDNSIIKQDFLLLDISYKEGRLFIGNPPFGDRFNIGRQFVKKCIELGDYVAFILPISQYRNKYLFDNSELIYTENLGNLLYSDRSVHCCFNIYKRNISNAKDNLKMENIVLFESIKNSDPKRNKPYVDENYDFRICSWGASAGRILKDNERYAKEIGFYINGDNLKKRVKCLISNANWKEEYFMTSTPNLVLWQIVDYLKKNIEEL